MTDGSVPPVHDEVPGQDLKVPPPPSGRGRARLIALVLVPVLGLGVGGALLVRRGADEAPRPTETIGAADGSTPSGPSSGSAGAPGASSTAPATDNGTAGEEASDLSPPVITDLTAPLGTKLIEPGSDASAGQLLPGQVMSAAAQVTVKDVTVTLTRRTTALRTRNEKAYLATFDPAKPALVEAQRTLFRNLVQLPLVSPVFRASGIGSSGKVTTSYVSLLHQFRGVDAEAAELSKVEQWTRRKGVVVTTATAPVPGQSNTRYAPLDQQALTVRNGPLVTVVGGDDVDLDALDRTAEKAAKAVRAVWGTRPGPTRFVLFASHDPRSLGTWFGVNGSPGQAIAVTMPQVAMIHQTKYAGARVVVDLSRTPDDDLYRVLRHEFAHAVDVRTQILPRRPATQAFPVWAEEGFASWMEELDVPVDRSTRVQEFRYLRRYWNRALPPATRSAFYAPDERMNQHYATASLVYRYIATRWGAPKAVAFYTSVAGGRSAAAWKVLGTDQAAFTRDWATYVDGLLAA